MAMAANQFILVPKGAKAAPILLTRHG